MKSDNMNKFYSYISIVLLFNYVTSFHKLSSYSNHYYHKYSLNMNSKSIDYTNLGSSDLLVSKICLGTMTWGQQNTIEEGIEQLDIAFNEYNINFLDTAEIYPVPTKAETQGDTDRVISKWLKTRYIYMYITIYKMSSYII